jgi:hypothetical protein
METAPARVADDVVRATGRKPEAVHGEYENLRQKMWDLAQPEYEKAYAVGPIGSSKLDALLARPFAKVAMQHAYNTVREQGGNPEELGLVNVDNMDDWLTHVPTRDAQLERVSKLLDRRGSSAANPNAGRGRSLVDWISRNGGIAGAEGELSAMDAQLWHRDGAYRRKLIQDPVMPGTGGIRPDTPDGWATRAWEAGYFPDHREGPPGPRELLDAISAELRGNPRYAKEADPRVADRLRMLDEAEHRLRQGDEFDAPDPEQFGGFSGDPEEAWAFHDHADEPVTRVPGRPEPRQEPAHVYQPSMQTLDLMKRAMDDIIEKDYREPLTRQLNLDDRGRARVQTVKELRDELVNLTRRPDGSSVYQDALYRGGDAPRLDQAWRDGPKLFSPALSEREFNARWETMSRNDRNAALGAYLEDLNNRARTGRLRIKELTTPAFRAKLQRAVGRDRAAYFFGQMQKELQLAAGARMSPTANSPTAEILQANRELDTGTGFFADIERGLDAGQNPLTVIPTAITRAAVSPIAGFVRGVQSPYRQGVRDELGRILLSPDATIAALKSAPKKTAGKYPSGYVTAPLSARISALANQ